MILLKFAVMAICSALFWLGGYSWKPARRFILPTILTATALLFTHSWWCLLMLSSMATFSLGYGDNSIFRKIFGNGWGRGVYGLLSAICLSLILLLTHHIGVWFFVGYLALNFSLENALKNIPQKIGDPIIGAGFASIIFLIH